MEREKEKVEELISRLEGRRITLKSSDLSGLLDATEEWRKTVIDPLVADRTIEITKWKLNRKRKEKIKP